MKNIGFATLFIVFLIAVILLFKNQQTNDYQAIQRFATDNQGQIISVERCYWRHPFWFATEDARIYEVIIDTKDGQKTAYLNLNMFGEEIKWK